jgi:dethiobiotin synthetase
MGCLFVTGTDTGVGKTIFSLALLAALRARGVDAVAFKPVETGCSSVPGSSNELVGDDCRALARVTGQSPDQVAGRLYSLPAAPMVAAAERGETVDVDSLAADVRALADEHELVLVEGAGGLLVPLAPSLTWIDFLARAPMPVVCVVASRLGCINHALLTMSALRSAGVELAGYVMNQLADDDSPGGNGQAIADFGHLTGAPPCLGMLTALTPEEILNSGHLARLGEAKLEINALLDAAHPPVQRD